jgi:hypothetical protein
VNVRVCASQHLKFLIIGRKTKRSVREEGKERKRKNKTVFLLMQMGIPDFVCGIPTDRNFWGMFNHLMGGGGFRSVCFVISGEEICK